MFAASLGPADMHTCTFLHILESRRVLVKGTAHAVIIFVRRLNLCRYEPNVARIEVIGGEHATLFMKRFYDPFAAF